MITVRSPVDSCVNVRVRTYVCAYSRNYGGLKNTLCLFVGRTKGHESLQQEIGKFQVAVGLPRKISHRREIK